MSRSNVQPNPCSGNAKTKQEIKQVVVIGAGVVGLSTAVCLLESGLPLNVTIIADKFNEQITSHGAVGIFRPTLEKTPGVPMERLMRWMRDSWTHYDRLIFSADASVAGIHMLAGYNFFDDPEDLPIYKDVIYNFRECTEKEKATFSRDRPYRYGFFCNRMIVECSMYLPYLQNRFFSKGGKLIKATVKSLSELTGAYDLIVNCTGMRSQVLVGDKKLVPIRGHVIRVKAPWIRVSIHYGKCMFMIPGQNYVFLGTTRQINDTTVEARQEDREKILNWAKSVYPSLRNCPVEGEWIGFRPHRNPLRLEVETIGSESGSIPVVHNYGHGAEGVSLSWGTAVEATKLVKQQLFNDAPLLSHL